MHRIETHTGGIFQTNAYAVPTPSGRWLLVDAPEGVVDWAKGRGWEVAGLLLTHAHIDHIAEAAAVRRAFDCPVYYHRDGERFLQDRDAFRRYGLDVDLEPVTGGQLIDEAERIDLGGVSWRTLLVPGHCPGSLCFFREEDRVVYAGDTLFAGSIGRTDLPFGDHELLVRGIREKLFPLGDDVQVLSGHGPATTIGQERETNPYLA
jgi:hydroxyacylglutathione hydrolase